MTCLLLPALALLALLPAQGDTPPPARRLVCDDLTLSLGVAIDDPGRLIVYEPSGPRVLERKADSEPWAGDPRVWSEGEFVENAFPAIYPAGTPGVNIAVSKHIRIIYGNHPLMTDDYVRGNLRLFEECLKLYHFKLGMPVPFESRDPAKRDGRKHKVDVLVGASNLPPHNGKPQYTGGGAFGGYDERGFGYLYVGPDYMRHTPPSGATPHELGHSCQMQCQTHSKGSGFWWEAHANWMQLQFLNSYPGVGNVPANSAFYAGHGRHYYDCWQIFEHLAEEPGFGHAFVRRLWAEGPDQEYIWTKAERFAAPRDMKDEWAKAARRSVTWDFRKHEHFVNSDKDDGRVRFGRAVLEPDPLRAGWWRVPSALAPQQFGYNLCPLRPLGRSVTVELQGLPHPGRGADWRASLVAVDAAGRPRYSPLFASGAQSMALDGTERELVLVVCATPRVMEITADQPYRSEEKLTFPYEVRLEGAVPRDPLAEEPAPTDKEGRPVAGAPHRNGSGFVAATATVEPTAFVGPRARVLDRARVLGAARVEDLAVVRDEAEVSGRAIISGHALVRDRAKVGDDARVAGFAVVKENARVSQRARLLQHATASGPARVSGDATLKGRAVTWALKVGDDALLDGDYANSLNVDSNAWFLWLVKQQKDADAAPKTRGLYALYDFRREHPSLLLDSHGAADAVLRGAPPVRRDNSLGLTVEEADQADDVPRLDLRDLGRDNWGGLVRGWLHPPETAEYRFHVASDNESELRLSPNATPAGARKVAGLSGGWCAPGEYQRFPGQISAPVRLVKGQAYYFEALIKDRDGLDLLQVAWSRGGGAPEIIEGEFLSTAPGGPRGAARRLVWHDLPGATVADLTGHPRFKPDARRPVETAHLLLNGRDQWAELPADLAFQHDWGVSLRLQLAPGARSATVWEFGSPDGRNALRLDLSADGIPRFIVRQAGQERAVAAPSALRPGWETVGVSLSDAGAVLQVGGRIVAEDAALRVRPWDLGLDRGFLGRGQAGGLFAGGVAEVTVRSAALVDRRPPRPDPAAFELAPVAINASTLVMRAVVGDEPGGTVEYRFADLGRGFDSGWSRSPRHVATGLAPGRSYQVAVAMRDLAGNTGKRSEAAAVTLPTREPDAFTFRAGRCEIQAEAYHAKHETATHAWKPVKRDDFGGGAGVATEDIGRTAELPAALTGESPRLDYRVNIPKPGVYGLTVRCWSIHDGNNSLFAGADHAPAQTEKSVSFPPKSPVWTPRIDLHFSTPGIHVVHLWMAKDGAYFDALALDAPAPEPAPAIGPVRLGDS